MRDGSLDKTCCIPAATRIKLIVRRRFPLPQGFQRSEASSQKEFRKGKRDDNSGKGHGYNMLIKPI